MSRYGPWAVIAGASEGIGAAFAEALAKEGINLVLVARQPEPLADLATRLTTRPGPAKDAEPSPAGGGKPAALGQMVRSLVGAMLAAGEGRRPVQWPASQVECRCVAADLSTDDGLEAVFTAAKGLEVGLVVANAALSPIGPFAEADPAELTRAVDLNCRAPMLLARHFLPAMQARRRGGIVIMSSLAGQQGSPGLSAYAATKAFGAVLAEGLWAEAREHGVGVVTCVAGAVSTPGLQGRSKARAPGTLPPQTVAAVTLRALTRGRGPRVVPGALMRFSSVLMTRLMPKRTAIAMIARASRKTLA